MIPRLLVPSDVRAPQIPDAPPRRLNTPMDERVVVASNLPHISLDTHSNIPSHLPLEVLASRVVVPRDTPAAPLDPASIHPDYAPLTGLDERTVVPAAMPVVHLNAKALVAARDLPDVLDADVLTTGVVNLMVAPVEQSNVHWNMIARVGSIGVHMAFLIFLLLAPKLFPYRGPTQEQVDMARQQLNFIYMPSDVRGLPPTPAQRSPQMHIDPRVLQQMAPKATLQIPQPRAPEQQVARSAPAEPPPDLPTAPKPQISEGAAELLPVPQARTQTQPQPQSQAPPTPNGLILPRISSPGRTLEQSAQQALGDSGGTSIASGGRIPGGARIPNGAGSNDGGEGEAGAGITMLTPTEGIDFTSYLARVLASVKRNWYAVMPESAQLGDKGRVVLQFRILRDGGVPAEEPRLMDGSGKVPLDRAAISSIRSSSPFEPLPPGFSSPYIELRFIFLYNLPMNTQ